MVEDSTATTDRIVIERTFEAPPALVWRMWTDPDHFKRWYGPDAVSIPVAEMDVRVGGRRLLCMQVETPDGSRKMWFTGEYLEVVENRRLVYTDSMSDEHGNVITPEEAGMPEGHPVTTRVTVQLDDLRGHTRMTMTHAGVPQDSPAAAGWEMAFDKLATYVQDQPG